MTDLFVLEPHDGLRREDEPKLFILEHSNVVETEPALANHLVAHLSLCLTL